jgi:hypothetical protein
MLTAALCLKQTSRAKKLLHIHVDCGEGAKTRAINYQSNILEEVVKPLSKTALVRRESNGIHRF